VGGKLNGKSFARPDQSTVLPYWDAVLTLLSQAARLSSNAPSVRTAVEAITFDSVPF